MKEEKTMASSSGGTSGEPLTVAKYLSGLIALSEKSQGEIAEEVGYTGTGRNMISMLKSGKARLPLNKVGRMARALNVDPRHLLRLVMREYSPETWAVLEEIIGEGSHEGALTQSEGRVLAVARACLKGDEIDMGNPRIASRVEAVFYEIADLQARQRNAAIERYDRAPLNAKNVRED